MKMETKLRKSEKRVVACEVIIIMVFAALVVYGTKQIICGSLFAVLWTPLTALAACMTGDDCKRIIGEAKRRDGNG